MSDEQATPQNLPPEPVPAPKDVCPKCGQNPCVCPADPAEKTPRRTKPPEIRWI